jgi:hypothetical protein
MTALILKRLSTFGALGALAIVSSAGCGVSSQAYTPTSPSARQAVDAALSAWQKGQTPESLASAAQPVHAVDSQWQSGQVLEGYEILSEESGDPEKRFSVRLTLKKPQGEKKVQYIVVGQGPLWVYRDDDYARLLNMDNNPKPPGGRNRPGAPGRH